MYGFEIDQKTIDEIVDGVVEDIRSHRQGEYYDSDEDPFEGVDSFFENFLGDIRYLADKKMTEKYVDENGDIL